MIFLNKSLGKFESPAIVPLVADEEKNIAEYMIWMLLIYYSDHGTYNENKISEDGDDDVDQGNNFCTLYLSSSGMLGWQWPGLTF